MTANIAWLLAQLTGGALWGGAFGAVLWWSGYEIKIAKRERMEASRAVS